MSRTTILCVLASAALSLVAARAPVFAQTSSTNVPGIDLSGEWAPVNSSDANMDLPGSEPGPVDFLGVPLNNASRLSTEMYSLDQLSEPERECSYYSPVYIMLGPFGLRISTQTEPRNGRVVAWVVGGWEDLQRIVIWMDGRAHPSKYAPHEMGGFTTGVWENDVLKAHTTHMRASIVRRNGTPLSDESELTTWFQRHDDELTILARIADPVYLTQPYMMTRTWRLFDAGPMPEVGVPCVITNEGVPEGELPFFLPGHNPFMTVESTAYGIPQDAVLGVAKTMYPDYRQFLKDKYVRPAKCPTAQASRPETACGGADKYGPRPP